MRLIKERVHIESTKLNLLENESFKLRPQILILEDKLFRVTQDVKNHHKRLYNSSPGGEEYTETEK